MLFAIVIIILILFILYATAPHLVSKKQKNPRLAMNQDGLVTPNIDWFSLGAEDENITSSENGTGLDPNWPAGWTYDWGGGHGYDRDMIRAGGKKNYGPPRRTKLM